jgi:hypothetical protein
MWNQEWNDVNGVSVRLTPQGLNESCSDEMFMQKKSLEHTGLTKQFICPTTPH